VTGIHDLLDAGYDRAFGYDDISRMTSADGGTGLWGTGAYSYDAMGNINFVHQERGRQLDFSYLGTTPQLTSVSGSAVTRDAVGNELTSSRAYSARNLMTALATTGLNRKSYRYVYDGRGIRLREEVTVTRPQTRTFFQYSVYSPELQLLSKGDAIPSPELLEKDFTGTDIIWLGNLPVAQTFTDAAATRFTFSDHLGTPLLQTNLSGTVVWRVEYDPYGSIYAYRTGSDADFQPLRLPGQEAEGNDQENSVPAYNIFRWYRAGWGRYTQADPRDLFLLSEHAFAYVGGNPMRRRDPLGLFAIDSSCSNNPFKKVAGAFASMCKATVEGTPCGNALKDASLLLFGNEYKLSKCFKSQCSGTQTTVRCDCNFSKACGQNVKTVGGNLITIGPGGSECPNGKLGSFEETAFHETMHSNCGLEAVEPDTENSYGKMFKYLEKKCYGWKSP
jgi:RHS repeat-associated protein